MIFYVGIDPSITNTGVVILSQDGEVIGTANSSSLRIPSPTSSKAKKMGPVVFDSYRYKSIASFICAEITNCVAQYCESHTDKDKLGLETVTIYIGYEDYSYNSVHRTYSIAEFNGILKLFLISQFQDVLTIDLISPRTAKLFATGKGTSGKDDMMKQAKEESKILRSARKQECTEDVCDAYFLALYSMYKYDTQIVEKFNGNPLLRERLELCTKKKVKKKRKKINTKKVIACGLEKH